MSHEVLFFLHFSPSQSAAVRFQCNFHSTPTSRVNEAINCWRRREVFRFALSWNWHFCFNFKRDKNKKKTKNMRNGASSEKWEITEEWGEFKNCQYKREMSNKKRERDREISRITVEFLVITGPLMSHRGSTPSSLISTFTMREGRKKNLGKVSTPRNLCKSQHPPRSEKREGCAKIEEEKTGKVEVKGGKQKSS